MSMRRTSLFLDDNLLTALRRAARREGVSVASLIREAVTTYLARPAPTGGVPTIAGRFASGRNDTAERTDELLWRDPHA